MDPAPGVSVEPIATRRTPDILVVDDQAEHLLLIQRALAAQDPKPNVREARDGNAALEMMRERVPDLVLLDLNMPGMTGQEVLEKIRADDALRCVPVSILSSSSRREDVVASYERHANAYVQKPVGFRALQDAMATVVDHWFNKALVPTSPE